MGLPSHSSWLAASMCSFITLLFSILVTASCLCVGLAGGSWRVMPLSTSIDDDTRNSMSSMNEMSAVEVVLSRGTLRFS